MRRLNLPSFTNSLKIFSDSGPCGGVKGLVKSGDGGSDGGLDGCAPDCPESDGLVGGLGSGGRVPVDCTESDGEYGPVGGPGSELGRPESSEEYGHGGPRSDSMTGECGSSLSGIG